MEATIFIEKQAACWYSNLLLGNIADTKELSQQTA